MLIVHPPAGIAHLTLCIWHKLLDELGLNWTVDLIFLLFLDISYGAGAFGWLGILAGKFGQPHNPISLLLREEIMVLVPRLLVPLLVHMGPKPDSFVSSPAISCATSSDHRHNLSFSLYSWACVSCRYLLRFLYVIWRGVQVNSLTASFAPDGYPCHQP